MTINALDAGDEPRRARQFDGWLGKPVPLSITAVPPRWLGFPWAAHDRKALPLGQR